MKFQDLGVIFLKGDSKTKLFLPVRYFCNQISAKPSLKTFSFFKKLASLFRLEPCSFVSLHLRHRRETDSESWEKNLIMKPSLVFLSWKSRWSRNREHSLYWIDHCAVHSCSRRAARGPRWLFKSVVELAQKKTHP